MLKMQDDPDWVDVQAGGPTDSNGDLTGRVGAAAARGAAATEVVCEIEGGTYRQAPFKYQGKCLEWLRADYAALSPDDRARVDGVLAGTGCEVLFE